MKPPAGLSMRTLRGIKRKTANLSAEPSKTRYNSSTGGKKEKSNGNELCKDDKRTAKEGPNTNHRLTQPDDEACDEAARIRSLKLHVYKQSIRHVSIPKYL